MSYFHLSLWKFSHQFWYKLSEDYYVWPALSKPVPLSCWVLSFILSSNLPTHSSSDIHIAIFLSVGTKCWKTGSQNEPRSSGRDHPTGNKLITLSACLLFVSLTVHSVITTSMGNRISFRISLSHNNQQLVLQSSDEQLMPLIVQLNCEK